MKSPCAFQTRTRLTLAANLNPTSWDHGEGIGDQSSFEHSTAPMFDRDASDGADATQPAAVDVAEATAESSNRENAAGTTDCEDTADPDDTIDADLLELLAQDFNCGATVATDHGPPASSGQPQSVRSPSPDPGPPLSVQSEHGNLDGQPQLIVETFPLGSPGSPIPGARQGSNVYQSSHELFGSSIWAPFRSQCDWEFTRWAKTRGPTSSAVADLLAIPEVRMQSLLFVVLLTQIGRSPTSLGCPIAHQRN
ncbi:hypothetical protein EDB85DRAFT_2172376 [Lactarius pseudohatsudake]|nr:hypothetical protein EDB85DRAFT_2172376 [Lactarius pseudohatsudake]